MNCYPTTQDRPKSERLLRNILPLLTQTMTPWSDYLSKQVKLCLGSLFHNLASLTHGFQTTHEHRPDYNLIRLPRFRQHNSWILSRSLHEHSPGHHDLASLTHEFLTIREHRPDHTSDRQQRSKLSLCWLKMEFLFISCLSIKLSHIISKAKYMFFHKSAFLT